MLWKLYAPVWPFGQITLVDGSVVSRWRDAPFMRRRADGVWQYRRVADVELSDHQHGSSRMEFVWREQDGGRCVLSPSTISVREVDGFHRIFVGECPMDARYSSQQGAKLDAWQFAVAKRKALFGSRRIRLRA